MGRKFFIFSIIGLIIGLLAVYFSFKEESYVAGTLMVLMIPFDIYDICVSWKNIKKK